MAERALASTSKGITDCLRQQLADVIGPVVVKQSLRSKHSRHWPARVRMFLRVVCELQIEIVCEMRAIALALYHDS